MVKVEGYSPAKGQNDYRVRVMMQIAQLLVMFFKGKLLERSVSGTMGKHSNSYLLRFDCCFFKNSEFTQKDGKTLVCDKRDRAITCVFCRDLHLTPMFSGPLQKDLFKGK